MNLIYFYKFSASFHHYDEFDVFFDSDAVPGLRAKTARGRTDPVSAARKTAYSILRAVDAGSIPPRVVSVHKPRI
jgi:hypothetical protein